MTSSYSPYFGTTSKQTSGDTESATTPCVDEGNGDADQSCADDAYGFGERDEIDDMFSDGFQLSDKELDDADDIPQDQTMEWDYLEGGEQDIPEGCIQQLEQAEDDAGDFTKGGSMRSPPHPDLYEMEGSVPLDRRKTPKIAPLGQALAPSSVSGGTRAKFGGSSREELESGRVEETPATSAASKRIGMLASLPRSRSSPSIIPRSVPGSELEQMLPPLCKHISSPSELIAGTECFPGSAARPGPGSQAPAGAEREILSPSRDGRPGSVIVYDSVDKENWDPFMSASLRVLQRLEAAADPGDSMLVQASTASCRIKSPEIPSRAPARTQPAQEARKSLGPWTVRKQSIGVASSRTDSGQSAEQAGRDEVGRGRGLIRSYSEASGQSSAKKLRQQTSSGARNSDLPCSSDTRAPVSQQHHRAFSDVISAFRSNSVEPRDAVAASALSPSGAHTANIRRKRKAADIPLTDRIRELQETTASKGRPRTAAEGFGLEMAGKRNDAASATADRYPLLELSNVLKLTTGNRSHSL
jgi:hypothetical protein